jgi:hypothetical protein
MVHADVEPQSDVWSRTWRTFGQGAVVAALVSVGSVLTTLDNAPNWATIGLACGQAALTAVVTYAHNKLSPQM